MRALIVEDEFLNRKVLTSFLSKIFDVDVATTGVELLKAFREAHDESRPFDLILLDIMMPELDGMEALERLRAEEKKLDVDTPVKVIMTTALDDPNTVIRSFHDGAASAYIVKPVDRDKLFGELKKLGLPVE